MSASTSEDNVLSICRENKVTLLWKISNFSKYTTVGEKLQSPTFSILTNVGGLDEWYLVCYPNGNTEDYKNYVGVYLCSLNRFRTSFELSFELKNHPVVRGNINFDTRGGNVGQPKFVERTFLRNYNYDYLPNDVLSIMCRIEIKQKGIPALLKKKVKTTWTLTADMNSLLGSEENSDFQIIVGNKTFRVHKSILSARSPYFRAMFSHDMLENVENKVYLDDMEEEVAEEMLKFIYTGGSPQLDKFADRLLVVAEKYGLEQLKELSELQMIDNLAVDSASLYLSTASQYNLVELKAACFDFISQNIKAIKDTPGFYEINKTDPTLFMELFQFYVKKTLTISQPVEN